jgi:hypothetical protein
MSLELTIRFMNFLLSTRTVPFFAQSRAAWTVIPQRQPDHAVQSCLRQATGFDYQIESIGLQSPLPRATNVS